MSDEELTDNNPYTIMQRGWYDREASAWNLENKDPVVGSFDAHNAWTGYDALFADINTTDRVALEFGCGPGRNIVRYNSLFQRIDGADISDINLEKAKIWMAANGLDVDKSKLYHTNGIALNDVPSNAYDVAFSVICLQHIAVYDIRFNLLTELHRVLKSGGWFTAQMGFGPRRQDAANYYENRFDMSATNGAFDVKVESPDQLCQDLYKIGFVDFSYVLMPVGPGDNHDNWIFFRARKP